MIKSACVLGGGNAGLMMALYLRASFSKLKITIVKSDKIGTIGVGEGSTEHWAVFAKVTGITTIDIMKECGATFKAGIKFENWNGDGKSYYHALPEFLSELDQFTGLPNNILKLISDNIPAEELCWDKSIKGLVPEPFETSFAQFHFDSEQLNAFLIKKCIERNITVINAEVTDAVLDEQGYISHLIDTDNQTYYADFFIDSSGFKRIISNKLGSKWLDYSEYLPMNSAIAFPTPYEEEIIPLTLARSMNAGWQWRSPIQERFGNGYVFCDSFITEDQAVSEIQQYFKDPIQIARKINFTSGQVDKCWIKNCVSVGLSSSFIEPLEASSISTTIQQCRLLIPALTTWVPGDESTINEYNRAFTTITNNILDFVQLHYFTKRKDTEFWKWCKYNLKPTKFITENLENFKKNFINQTMLPTSGFGIYDVLNWAQVMHGLGMFDILRMKEIYKDTCNHTEQRTLDIMNLVKNDNRKFYKIREAIDIIIARNS
jgi:tryptophan halogenase